MPMFAMKFERKVTTYDTFHRVVEAATLEEAQAIADMLAPRFNHDCPDDATEVQGASEFGDWIAEASDDVEEHEAPDYDASGNPIDTAQYFPHDGEPVIAGQLPHETATQAQDRRAADLMRGEG